MRDFKQLKVWEKAHRLVLDVYQSTRKFPGDERFGLTSQIRRAAISVPSNIAEGCGRLGERELSQFLSIASGSSSEVEYQLLLACDLGYLSSDQHQVLDEKTNEVKRMLNAFSRKLTQANS